MSKKYLFLVVITALLGVATFSARAYTACSPTKFPYCYFYFTENTRTEEFPIENTTNDDAGKDGSDANQYTLIPNNTGKEIGFQVSTRPNGPAKDAADNTVGKVLIWATVDIPDYALEKWTDTGGGTTSRCPSFAGAPEGVFGYFDSRGVDDSPAAFTADGKRGIVDCGTEGQMVYWKNQPDNPRQTNSYNFKFKLKPGINTKFCVRANVSVYYSDRSGAPDRSDRTYDGVFPPANQAPDGRYTAAHIAKQTKRFCYQLKNNPPQGTFSIPACDKYTVSGYDPDNISADVGYHIDYDSAGTSTKYSGSTNKGGRTFSGGFTPGKTYYLRLNDGNSWTYIGSATAPACYTPPPPGDICFNYTATDPGRTADGRPSYTDIYIDSFFPINPGNGGTVGVFRPTTKRFDYAPSNQNINLMTIQYAYTRHRDVDPDASYTDKTGKPVTVYKEYYQWDEVNRQNFRELCYSARCDILGWSGPGADNRVRANEDFTVTVRAVNDGPHYLPAAYAWGTYPLGLGGTGGEHPWGHGLAIGQTVTKSVTLRAPPNAQYYGVGLAPGFLSGGFALGPQCGASVPIYERFSVDNLSAAATLNPDEENPNSFSYSTNLCVRASTAVRINTYSKAYKVPYASGAENLIDQNAGGDYGCGTIWSGSRAVSGPVAGDKYCTTLTASPTAGWVGPGGPTDTMETSGAYNSGPVCQTVHDEPYVQAFGSDVRAGGGFGSLCTTTPGGIKTYLTQTGIQPVGSGVQIGALSIGPIAGFSSATLRNETPTGSTGLSFGNTTNTTGGDRNAPNLGGQLGGSHCVSDFFANRPEATAITNPNTGVGTTDKVETTRYYEPAGGTLTISGGTLSNGSQVAVYVKGNVVIDAAIKYASTNWGTIEDIPSFRLIASGNIYIKPNVDQLDGLYVAQPGTSTGGTIYTCANGTSQFSTAELYAQCRRQLIVNGAFVAQKAYLDRSFSSRRYSYPGERLGASLQNCGNSGNSAYADCAAEIFNFTPEMYLGRPLIPPSTGPTTGRYDYITSLAPVL